jgi:Glycosyl hydrolase family 63 C-terminal domain
MFRRALSSFATAKFMENAALTSQEENRLREDAGREKNWKRWGPYLSERQWGTVREDYSDNGDAWNYVPHDHARSRTYRWGEDGLLGFTDRECRLCFALALWNGRDPILKERLFGLSNPQGNHGEDVKECYFYLDSTPTHSYAKALYKYPQAEFPYAQLVAENARRGKDEREYEIIDTGVFEESRYFDVFVEYAKDGPDDVLIRITIENRGPEAATIHVLPTLWFRNMWSWGCDHEGCTLKPWIKQASPFALLANHPTLGGFRFEIETPAEFFFTENETNNERLFSSPNASPFAKDAFHDFVIHGRVDAVNAQKAGTKAAPHYRLEIPAQRSVTLRMRLRPENSAAPQNPFDGFDAIFSARIAEADEFYAAKLVPGLNDEQRRVVRQAYAGLLWSKQYYNYIVKNWLAGDPNMPAPPPGHSKSRNFDWPHLFNGDVISMPDKWEYPWYAAWDLAFHMIPFSRIDPDFAKSQLVLFLREWFMHPNGQLPAYEWNFSDVNPPVHAWACWRAYKIGTPKDDKGHRDTLFLERTFQKLLLNFNWWVNRKDVQGKHIFSGGFLGLDNVGLFDRSQPLPTGEVLEQADGTAWMAFYCGTMLSMALELAQTNPAYEDIASKFFEHFVDIVDAMNAVGRGGLWNEEDGFYYDQLLIKGTPVPLRVRSIVGVIPLLAAEVIGQDQIMHLPGFRKRMRWFLENRKDLAQHISYMDKKTEDGGECSLRLLAIPSRERLLRVLRYVLDEKEFLSPHGIRSMSRIYNDQPYRVRIDGHELGIDYEPGESRSGLFGGNSNWRGPVWMPINYLLIEALERYHHFYGDDFKVECPTGSGKMMNLAEVAQELASRLANIFLPDEKGARPCHGGDPRFAEDPHWRDLVLFNEYFHGETGRGLGASHQTGWTALVTRCLGMIGRISE